MCVSLKFDWRLSNEQKSSQIDSKSVIRWEIQVQITMIEPSLVWWVWWWVCSHVLFSHSWGTSTMRFRLAYPFPEKTNLQISSNIRKWWGMVIKILGFFIPLQKDSHFQTDSTHSPHGDLGSEIGMPNFQSFHSHRGPKMITLHNWHGTQKWRFGSSEDYFSFSIGWFVCSMLMFRGVDMFDNSKL